MKYKGYRGSLECCGNSSVLHGIILDIQDVITYQGETLDEAKKAFRDSVDDYLELCEKHNRKPNIPKGEN